MGHVNFFEFTLMILYFWELRESMKQLNPKINTIDYFLIVLSLLVCPSSAYQKVITEVDLQATRKLATTPVEQIVRDIISYAHTIRAFNPFTIRLINYQEEIDAHTPISDIWITLRDYPTILTFNISSNFTKSLEPDRRKTKTLAEGAIQMFSFFTVINACNSSNLNALIQQTVNPKLDFILFIFNIDNSTNDQETTNKYLIEFPVIPKLLHKILLTLSYHSSSIKPSILIESLDNFASEKKPVLISLPYVPEYPVKNVRMGYNLYGRHFLISSTYAPPYFYTYKPDNSSKLENKGTYTNIFISASLHFNFTYTITNDGIGYGIRLDNGTWTGKYARVYYPDSGYDIAILLPNHYLMRRGDRSVSISELNLGFVMAVPSKSHVPWYAFCQPFLVYVWVLLLGTALILGMIFAVVVYLFEYNASYETILNVATFLPLSVALEQSTSEIPRSVRGYLVIWVLACLVLGTAYKSKLRAFIMFPLVKQIPYTFSELSHLTDFKVTLMMLGNMEHNFFLEKSPLDTFWVKKLRKRLVVEYDWIKCLRTAVTVERHACITWKTGKAIIAQRLTLNTTIKPYWQSKENILQVFCGLAFQENSIFSTAFDLIVSSVHEMGIMKKWGSDLTYELEYTGGQQLIKDEGNSKLVRKLIQVAKGEEDKSPLKMRSLWGVFGLLGVGIILGFLVTLVERWVMKKWSAKIETEKRMKEIETIISGGMLLTLDVGNGWYEKCYLR